MSNKENEESLSSTSSSSSPSSFPLNKHSDKPSQRPVQHRCNGHLEDVLEGISQWPMDVSKPFSLFLACLKSTPGQEPERHNNKKQQ